MIDGKESEQSYKVSLLRFRGFNHIDANAISVDALIVSRAHTEKAPNRALH